MFLHNPKMMYAVRVEQPNPAFAKRLLELVRRSQRELAAAMRYFTQGWNEPDCPRRSMLLDTRQFSRRRHHPQVAASRPRAKRRAASGSSRWPRPTAPFAPGTPWRVVSAGRATAGCPECGASVGVRVGP